MNHRNLSLEVSIDEVLIEALPASVHGFNF